MIHLHMLLRLTRLRTRTAGSCYVELGIDSAGVLER
jgi:hypothetical protein